MPQSQLSQLCLAFACALACVYVAGRLWTTTHELRYLHEELAAATYNSNRRSLSDPYFASPVSETKDSPRVLFYNTRPGSGKVPPLEGARLEDDKRALLLPDGKLLGQLDSIEAGVASGWACFRGMEAEPLQVELYVDGRLVATGEASSQDSHDGVRQLCALDFMLTSGQGAPPRGVGFQLPLPPLAPGVHELAAFLVAPGGRGKQELNQSPVVFMEVARQARVEDELRRKDEIIRTRNAQIASLWEELHTRQPWRNALDSRSKISFKPPESEFNASRALAFIGINTGIGSRARRDVLRRTWVPTRAALLTLQREAGLVIRFVVGYSEQRGDSAEAELQAEMEEYGDILRLNMVDSYDQLALKTLRMFTDMPPAIDADFYFKVDDDVALNTHALAGWLQERRTRPNLYMGCFKSGPVLTDPKYKWYEPESWRFGDPTAKDGAVNYMRHATGQLYGVSRQVARYIGANSAVLHRFANEDVTLGAWLFGLDIEYVNEKRLCCDTDAECRGRNCIGYFELACAGICKSEERLEPIYHSCLSNEEVQKV